MDGLGSVVTRRSAEETSGEAVVVEALLWPRGPVATFGAEAHKRRFEVVAGWIGFDVEGLVSVLDEGGRVTVAPGRWCRVWNAGLEDAQFVCEARPGLQFEQQVHSIFHRRKRRRT
jgi:hypothetical protein